MAAFAGSIATSAFSKNIFFQFGRFLGVILFLLAISDKVKRVQFPYDIRS